ncbi:hypothetical protein IP69_06385 [Bosea sp. AAP35]|uniref:FecR family protein n=1 Tax=Bosea sp. AAP35 TaxID=1523417 RepID=UPI0006B982B2|nr:FecR family protein [Bosea sp. AAP35]KPF71328.1 hypothetical protein IP69_06385 [Bosea sp. AAP35]
MAIEWDIGRREFLAIATTMGVALAPDHAMAEAQAGQVTALSGEAVAQLNEARRALAMKAPVFVGDRVATGIGARANLLLGEATQLLLGERARLTIDRFIMAAGGTVTLGSGALVLDKTPGAGGALRVRSPYGLIAVRGTRFFAGPSNGVFGVFVVRGSVAVSAAGRRVLLGTGEGTDIARPGAAPSLARIWSDERVRAALAQVA